MRLAKKEQKMTMCAASLIAGLLVSGCQKGSSLEQFAKQVETAESIRMESILKQTKGSRPVTVLRKLPNQAITKSNDLTSLVNEKDGWVELNLESKQYAQAQWGGKFIPALGKLVSPGITSCYIAYGISPLRIAPAKDWKLTKNGNADVWKTEVQSPDGVQKFEIELDASGSLKRYLGPSGEFSVSKWEVNSSIDDKEFTVRVPDGFVLESLPIEYMDLGIGQKIKFESFVDNNKNKPGSGWSLVLFTDPADPLSAAMKSWMDKTKFAATKLEVALGTGGDYSVKEASAFWTLISATPTCALINKEGEIQALWQGFDKNDTARLEREITTALKEHS
jgi:hypothetical protein